MNDRSSSCARTDAVLAIYLDGDVDMDASGFEFACVETLTLHLRECRTCQRELQRARRLDAMLAENAGRTIARHANAQGQLDELASRCFATAVARIEAERAMPAELLPGSARLPVSRLREVLPLASLRNGARQHAPLLAAGIGGLALMLAAWWSGPGNAYSVAESAHKVAGPLADHPTANLTTVPPAAPSTTPPAAPSSVPAENRVASSSAPGAIVVARGTSRRPPTAPPTQTDPLQLLQRLADANAPTADRLASTKQLLQALRAGAGNGQVLFPALIDTLAAGEVSGPGRVWAAPLGAMAAIHGEVRDDAWFVAQLGATLQRLDRPKVTPGLHDLAAVTVAARLGGRELDASLLRAVRRHATLGPLVAAAVRSNLRAQGAGTLLLDAWGDRAERSAEAEDEFAAQAWFVGQPERVFEEVRAELQAARSSPRRIRCLLALAHSPTAACLDVLVAWTAAGCRAEAYAAAFALAQLPSRWLRGLTERANQEHDAFLLRAALARAGLREAAPWLDSLSLSVRERELLRDADFAQFPAVANWFRDRGGLGD